jgi:DNA-binding helix-hairpin-helix protein with protein kinase domain
LTTTNDLNRKRQDILNAQSSELDNALAVLKQTYLRTQLTRFAIREAWLAGIGPALRDSLARAGITTAAEIDYWRVRRVHGIGNVKAQALVGWRRDMERKAMLQGGPAQLDQATQQDIKNRFNTKIQAITAQEITVNQKVKDEQQQIRTHSNSLRQQIYTKKSEEQSQAAQHIESIRTEYSPEIEALSKQIQETISNAERERTLLNQALLSSRKSVMEKSFSLAQVQAELTRYNNITFLNYLKRLVSQK